MKICRICTLSLLVCVLTGSLFGQTRSNFLPASLPGDKTAPGGVSAVLATIPDKHGSTLSSDGTCLFYRFWIPQNQPDPEFIVLFLHGIGLHSGRYVTTAQQLNDSGIAVYALDTRGHGLSCGQHGRIPDSATENSDIAAMLATIRQLHPNAKLFLMAESMGSAFALNYATANPADISGMILMSPVFAVSSTQYRQWGALRYVADYFFRRNAPVVSLASRDKSGKIDPKAAATQPKDSLAYTKVSVNYLMGVHRATLHWQEKAPQVHIATLVMQSEHDPIVKPGSVQQFFNLLATRDKQYNSFPDVLHSLLGNLHSPDVLHGVSAWIEGH